MIAAVDGPALGGGTGLVANCHIVIASESASFGLTEIRLGLWPFLVYPAGGGGGRGAADDGVGAFRADLRRKRGGKDGLVARNCGKRGGAGGGDRARQSRGTARRRSARGMMFVQEAGTGVGRMPPSSRGWSGRKFSKATTSWREFGHFGRNESHNGRRWRDARTRYSMVRRRTQYSVVRGPLLLRCRAFSIVTTPPTAEV